MRWCCLSASLWMLLAGSASAAEAKRTIDFNHDVRPILSNSCFKCHGPDEKERKGGTDGLRLDTLAGATVDLGGYQAIKPGQPEASLIIKRVTSSDPDEVMPPRGHGKPLSAADVETLSEWIRQGANYALHWSYQKPMRPALPTVKNATWGYTPVDRFLLARLEKEGLTPQPPADDRTMIRRVALDLTGMPPTRAEVEAFLNDTSAQRYEHMVDQYLKKPAYGEHWARLWLDLARYADSAGYADDPSRIIWAYRDYVIRSFQQNKPFDQFTIEQIAGDLLSDPTDEQLIATAFQRNTLTNSEGGTNDEEFRNVAVVDRVNTTMAVWMGTTIACAQCHTHKYDPLSQEEFFKLFAFYNQSEDADRRDESPLLELWSDEQHQQKKAWQEELAQLEQTLKTTTPELTAAQQKWEASLPKSLMWKALIPAAMTRRSDKSVVIRDDTIFVPEVTPTDRYEVSIPINEKQTLTALRLETPGQAGLANGNFVLTRVQAVIEPPAGQPLNGRFVRIEIPGNQKILSLAEVQVFAGTENAARAGKATQSSTDYAGPPELAIDGNTDGRYVEAKSTTHTAQSDNPWWEVELKAATPIDRIAIWNRTDNGVGNRLAQFRVAILDDNRQPVWEKTVAEPPNPSLELSLSGARPIVFAAAFADYSQSGFNPADVLLDMVPASKKATGWAVGGQVQQPHHLTLLPSAAVELPAGSVLKVSLWHDSEHANHMLGQFRLVTTSEPQAATLARIPANVLNILPKATTERTPAEQETLAVYYRSIAPELQAARDRKAAVQKSLADIKPYTTVPVMRDLATNQRRKTQLQHRGNFMDLGQEVSEGVPAVFHSLPSDLPSNRMALARWLIDRENPLTARVMVNRLWEQLFGIGIVATSEEFGSQGELPSHPELLDWLAVEFMDSGWNVQHMLKVLVMSAAYRQSSAVTGESFQRDPDNRLLARGPRFRMSAEMIRDQALAVSGLLSAKQFGPPVNPPQPKLGVNAAFGSAVDWQTSAGEDKFRRALYTTWRRSNPYPSMSTFDAPNREVCTLRRSRTNTPLQALVTLNDPVYIEAAQALARKTMTDGGTTIEDQAKWAWETCLSRPPVTAELQAIVALFQRTKDRLASQPESAKKLAENPLGPAPAGMDLVTLAAWSVTANAILNLDEMFMRR